MITGWRLLLGTTLGLFALSIPARYRELVDAATASKLLLGEGPMSTLASPSLYPYLVLGLEVAFMVAVLGVSIGIAWQRTGDPRALFFSAVFVTYPVWVTPTLEALVLQPPLGYLVSLVEGIGVFFAVCFFLLFPNGRFVPRWTRWWAGAWAVYTLAWVVRPDAWFSLATPFEVPPVVFAAMMSGWVVGMAAQAIRYRWEADAAQRSQTKWVLVAIGLAIAGYGVVYLAGELVFQEGTVAVAYDLFGVPAFWLLALPMPVAFTIAMVRYQLFDYQGVVNRTLVYGALTAILGLVYLASIFVLGLVLNPVAVESDLAVAASTLIVAAFFSPARRRIQLFVDRRFYRHRYDAARTLEAFSARLRHEVDLETLVSDLTGVVRETLQPAHVSVWVRGERS